MNKNVITVLQVLPALVSGGVERGTVEIDNAIAQRGWNSLVASSGGPLESQLKGRVIRLALNSKNPLRILLNAYLLQAIIKKNNVDIIHARSRAPAWSAYLAAQATKKIFLTTFHGAYNIQNRIKRCYNRVMVKGQGIIAISEYIKSHILKSYGIAQEKITVIPRGVDLEKFHPEIKPKKIGLPQNKKIVMLPGRITRWKGQHIFIEAMRELDALGVIIGKVESAGYAAELKRNLPANIFILPQTSDMPGVMANADVVVSASIEPEAFGRIAIEAQALGKPIVATNIGASLETVIHGSTGFLIPPANPAAMKDAIREVLKSQRNWVNACRQNASQYSTKLMCQKTLNIYEKLLKR